jgi:hypothetical protein
MDNPKPLARKNYKKTAHMSLLSFIYTMFIAVSLNLELELIVDIFILVQYVCMYVYI